jgi:primase-polymerase (primpol)-like protein
MATSAPSTSSPPTPPKPETHNGDLRSLPAALVRLTARNNWVVWPWELRQGAGEDRWTKPPFDPKALTRRGTLRRAKVNDPSTWGTYEEAVRRVEEGLCEGIGFMLAGANVGPLDIDHAYDLVYTNASSMLMPWTEDLLRAARGAYVEFTVSGRGLRVIGLANGGELHRRFNFDREGAGIELYRNTARYITVSGLEVSNCKALPYVDRFLDDLLAKYDVPERDAEDYDLTRVDRVALTFDDIGMLLRGVDEASTDRSANIGEAVWRLARRGMGPV